jgi:hypothetical protein
MMGRGENYRDRACPVSTRNRRENSINFGTLLAALINLLTELIK